MTDKNDMLHQIEDALGSEGSHDDAQRMFDTLKAAGKISFDPVAGYQMAEIDENEWVLYLAESCDDFSWSATPPKAQKP